MENSALAQMFFINVPVAAALAMLMQIQHNIMTTENRLTNFCHQQYTRHTYFHYSTSFLIGQNSTYLTTKENIKIKAGIGEFSRQEQEIKIDGHIVPLNEDGFVSYEIPAGRPGKHLIPIRISYKDVDGKWNYIDRQVTYTVVDSIK